MNRSSQRPKAEATCLPIAINPWQVLPALSDEEFAQLKADIAQRGVAVPVVVDADTGLVIDGVHRVRAWEELRKEGTRVPDYPREVHRFASDEERLSFSVAANLFRRHLTRTQRADVVARLREMGWATRRIAGVMSVHHTTVVRDLEIGAGAPFSGPERIERQGGGTYPARRPKAVPAIVVRSARDEARARAALAALGDEAPGTDLRRAEEKARLAALARRRAEEVPSKVDGPGWEIRTGDFREVLADIPDQSVDAIVTDPPYNVEGVPLYSDLSAFAARVLKPGRLCIAYCGKMALPEHFERLGEHLEYVWTGAIFLPGRHTIFRQKMIFGRWRPVAFFSAGQYEIRTTIVDALWAEGSGEKSLEDHPWRQAVEPVRRLVEMATMPEELVLDPFLGSGTTAEACATSRRRLIGADVDPGAVALAFERLRQLL
ncbi:MAG: DNA methyltransferase [Acidimicrobiales bacterium]|jgi:ParB-like chromosome segregation protein Spo0J